MEDKQIAAMSNVPVAVAAAYIGKTPEFIRCGLIYRELPFGSAVKLKRYVYNIPGPALVRYKHYGREQSE